MSEIIEIRHELPESEKLVVVDWGVSDVCNYRCSYCPPNTNQGKNPFYPIEKILAFSDKIIEHYKTILGKEVYFIYTGGEVTLFKDFLRLVKTQKESGHRVGISSNGSKDLNFWREAQEYLEHISLSYHDEYTDLNHFIDVVNEVKHKPYTHVNVMVRPDAFKKCLEAAYRILEETENITMDLQIILRDFIEPYPYTEDQKHALAVASQDVFSKIKLKREVKGFRGSGCMRLIYADGKEELVKGASIITRNLHAFKGWKCHIGMELLVVDVAGNIRRSWCGQGGILGHVNDEDFVFPSEPNICQIEWCSGGITDLMTTKER